MRPLFSVVSVAVLLVALSAVALFGLSVMFMDPMHGGGCPFAFTHEAAVCGDTALSHFSMWQSAFAATLASLLVAIFAVGLSLSKRHDNDFLISGVRALSRTREPFRPPLFQELFSQGLLNPKIL